MDESTNVDSNKAATCTCEGGTCPTDTKCECPCHDEVPPTTPEPQQ